MADTAARVSKLTALHRDEFPFITIAVQIELEHPVSAGIEHFAILKNFLIRPLAGPARADHELADAKGLIQLALRILRGKALVVVVIAAQYHLHPRGIQLLPEGIQPVRAAAQAGAPARVMPIRQSTVSGVRSQVFLQPGHLRRAGAASVNPQAGGVEYDDVPIAYVIAVPAFANLARRLAEVCEVVGSVVNFVFVVAGGRADAVLKPPPGGIKTGLELIQGRVFIDVVTGGEDYAGDVIQQGSGLVIALLPADGNITRTNQHSRCGSGGEGGCCRGLRRNRRL